MYNRKYRNTEHDGERLYAEHRRGNDFISSTKLIDVEWFHERQILLDNEYKNISSYSRRLSAIETNIASRNKDSTSASRENLPPPRAQNKSNPHERYKIPRMTPKDELNKREYLSEKDHVLLMLQKLDHVEEKIALHYQRKEEKARRDKVVATHFQQAQLYKGLHPWRCRVYWHLRQKSSMRRASVFRKRYAFSMYRDRLQRSIFYRKLGDAISRNNVSASCRKCLFLLLKRTRMVHNGRRQDLVQHSSRRLWLRFKRNMALAIRRQRNRLYIEICGHKYNRRRLAVALQTLRDKAALRKSRGGVEDRVLEAVRRRASLRMSRLRMQQGLRSWRRFHYWESICCKYAAQHFHRVGSRRKLTKWRKWVSLRQTASSQGLLAASHCDTRLLRTGWAQWRGSFITATRQRVSVLRSVTAQWRGKLGGNAMEGVSPLRSCGQTTLDRVGIVGECVRRSTWHHEHNVVMTIAGEVRVYALLSGALCALKGLVRQKHCRKEMHVATKHHCDKGLSAKAISAWVAFVATNDIYKKFRVYACRQYQTWHFRRVLLDWRGVVDAHRQVRDIELRGRQHHDAWIQRRGLSYLFVMIHDMRMQRDSVARARNFHHLNALRYSLRTLCNAAVIRDYHRKGEVHHILHMQRWGLCQLKCAVLSSARRRDLSGWIYKRRRRLADNVMNLLRGGDGTILAKSVKIRLGLERNIDAWRKYSLQKICRKKQDALVLGHHLRRLYHKGMYIWMSHVQRRGSLDAACDRYRRRAAKSLFRRLHHRKALNDIVHIGVLCAKKHFGCRMKTRAFRQLKKVRTDCSMSTGAEHYSWHMCRRAFHHWKDRTALRSYDNNTVTTIAGWMRKSPASSASDSLMGHMRQCRRRSSGAVMDYIRYKTTPKSSMQFLAAAGLFVNTKAMQRLWNRWRSYRGMSQLVVARRAPLRVGLVRWKAVTTCRYVLWTALDYAKSHYYRTCALWGIHKWRAYMNRRMAASQAEDHAYDYTRRLAFHRWLDVVRTKRMPPALLAWWCQWNSVRSSCDAVVDGSNSWQRARRTHRESSCVINYIRYKSLPKCAVAASIALLYAVRTQLHRCLEIWRKGIRGQKILLRGKQMSSDDFHEWRQLRRSIVTWSRYVSCQKELQTNQLDTLNRRHCQSQLRRAMCIWRMNGIARLHGRRGDAYYREQTLRRYLHWWVDAFRLKSQQAVIRGHLSRWCGLYTLGANNSCSSGAPAASSHRESPWQSMRKGRRQSSGHVVNYIYFKSLPRDTVNSLYASEFASLKLLGRCFVTWCEYVFDFDEKHDYSIYYRHHRLFQLRHALAAWRCSHLAMPRLTLSQSEMNRLLRTYGSMYTTVVEDVHASPWLVLRKRRREPSGLIGYIRYRSIPPAMLREKIAEEHFTSILLRRWVHFWIDVYREDVQRRRVREHVARWHLSRKIGSDSEGGRPRPESPWQRMQSKRRLSSGCVIDYIRYKGIRKSTVKLWYASEFCKVKRMRTAFDNLLSYRRENLDTI